MSERQTAYAYDAVMGETVRAGNCRLLHHSPEAVENDPDNNVVEVLHTDFSHDPTEGCQGQYTVLLEEECPECGSNRLKSSSVTLAGVGGKWCPACGYDVEPA